MTFITKEGAEYGGFTVGHLAKMNRNPNPAWIVGIKPGGTTRLLLRFAAPQPTDVGPHSDTFELDFRGVSCTWRPTTATLAPYSASALPEIHSFGSAPMVVPHGFSLLKEESGLPMNVRKRYKGKPVVLVESAPCADESVVRVGVFSLPQSYSRWKQDGWYVHGVRYLSGAAGCVSNHYPDKKWRIVCDPRRGDILGRPGDFSYRSRDHAACAEAILAGSLSKFFV